MNDILSTDFFSKTQNHIRHTPAPVLACFFLVNNITWTLPHDILFLKHSF